MNKSKMVEWLRSNTSCWRNIYTMSCIAGWNIPKDWWLCFDGDSIRNDMYLTNKHPNGDESGDIISRRDYEAEQFKPVVIGYLNTRYCGKNCNDKSIYSASDCKTIILNDKYVCRGGAKKPKFRPVYGKG